MWRSPLGGEWRPWANSQLGSQPAASTDFHPSVRVHVRSSRHPAQSQQHSQSLVTLKPSNFVVNPQSCKKGRRNCEKPLNLGWCVMQQSKAKTEPCGVLPPQAALTLCLVEEWRGLEEWRRDCLVEAETQWRLSYWKLQERELESYSRRTVTRTTPVEIWELEEAPHELGVWLRRFLDRMLKVSSASF